MPRHNGSIRVLAAALFVIVGLGLALPAFSQNGPPPLPKNLKFPRPSGLPAVQQEEVLSYWTTENVTVLNQKKHNAEKEPESRHNRNAKPN